MDNKEKTQEFSLEDIMREFGSENSEPELAGEGQTGMPALDLEQTLRIPDLPAEEVIPLPEINLEETRRIPEINLEETRIIPEIPTEDTRHIPDLTLKDPERDMDMSQYDTRALPPLTPEEIEKLTGRKPEEAAGPEVPADDTIRLDDLTEVLERSRRMAQEARGQEESAQAEPEEESAEEASREEPVEETPREEPPRKDPIVFRSRLRELKRKLVAGPEKRYYELTEIGVGRVQAAILVCLLVVALCAGASGMYALGMVAGNRLKLMIFSQVLAMMVSALMGCYVLLDGIADLFTGRFSLNTMLVLTLAACAVDALFCLRELRVPCCAAFSLEMTFALWNRSLRRQTEMGQMDTLRKAVRLVGLVKQPDYHEGRKGILRTEGRLEDFMDTYAKRTGPERFQNIFSLLSVLACGGIAALAYTRHGLSLAVQILATSLLVAVPAGFFVSQSRPTAILQRRLHMVGTVLCGWQGVKTLCGKAMFPLTDRDLFPQGSVKLNGIKFLGDREPEQVIAYAAALMKANGGGLEPVFTQLRKSRGGPVYPAVNFQVHPEGGISGSVRGDAVLLGTREFLASQGVKMPEGPAVPQAVYCAVEQEFCAVFAINYSRTKSAAGGLVSLNGCRRVIPVILSTDFLITREMLRGKFGVRAKRYCFPERQVRDDLARVTPQESLIAGALATQDNLSGAAYAVSGARALRTSCRWGAAVHLLAGLVGLLSMAALAYLGSTELLTPVNVLLYQLVWLLPGLLITEWARVA